MCVIVGLETDVGNGLWALISGNRQDDYSSDRRMPANRAIVESHFDIYVNKVELVHERLTDSIIH